MGTFHSKTDASVEKSGAPWNVDPPDDSENFGTKAGGPSRPGAKKSKSVAKRKKTNLSKRVRVKRKRKKKGKGRKNK